jgi:VCBS repeat-containing protein
VCDPDGLCDTGTVTVTVNPVNDPPVAGDDSAATDGVVTIQVLANDTDPDGDELRVDIATDPANGSIVVNADGTITYTPDPAFEGVDTFTYTVCDTSDQCDTATVTVSVTQLGRITGTVWLDVDGDGLFDTDEFDLSNVQIDFVCAGADGTVGTADDMVLPPAFTGSPYLAVDVPPGYCQVTVDTSTLPAGLNPTFDVDGGLDATSLVFLNPGQTVSGIDFGFIDVNDPPMAVDDIIDTDEDTAATIPLLSNDSDPEGEPLTVDSVTQPANGTVVINADGTVTYTPDAEYSGVDTFTYTVCDAVDQCADATVTVTVSEVNDPPVVTTTEIIVTVGSSLPPLDSFDPETDGYTIDILSGNLPGGISMDASGAFSGTTSTTALLTLTVEACDDRGACEIYTIFIDVLPPILASPDGGNDVPATLARTGMDGDVLVVFAGILMTLGMAILLWSNRLKEGEEPAIPAPWKRGPGKARRAQRPAPGPVAPEPWMGGE